MQATNFCTTGFSESRPEIRCWVRDDLAKAGDAAFERRLIEDNFNRRQLGRLEIARAYRRLAV